MGCGEQCFDKESKWFEHTRCSTCPGQDSGHPNAEGKSYCGDCNDYHFRDMWPHSPDDRNHVKDYRLEKLKGQVTSWSVGELVGEMNDALASFKKLFLRDGSTKLVVTQMEIIFQELSKRSKK